MKTTSEEHNLNEIVFENRNKNYGAYVIRETYDQRVVQSLLITLLFFASLIGIVFGLHAIFAKAIPLIQPGKDIVCILDTRKIEIPVVTPPSKPSQQNKNSTVPTIIKDSVDTEKKIDSLLTNNNTPSDTSLTAFNDSKDKDTGGGSGQGGSLLPENNTPMEGYKLTKRPQFPGGDEALIKFLRINIHYPIYEREIGKEGTVYIEFVIDKEGMPTSFHLKKSVSEGCDNESLRVLGIMPKWEPGEFHEQKVSSLLVLPVNFKLLKN